MNEARRSALVNAIMTGDPNGEAGEVPAGALYTMEAAEVEDFFRRLRERVLWRLAFGGGHVEVTRA